MKIFLYVFYQLAKALVKIVDRIFFSKTIVRNRSALRRNQATIAVSNHPSTLLDPLNVAERINQMVYFLANASMFKHPVSNWFFSTFYCIPVERPKDVEGRRIQNDEAFKKADEFLTKGGTLYIAPEGGSAIDRRLRKIKTGTARIALSAENKNDFKLGLEILPVGLNYEDQTAFRSQLFINVGAPIKMRDYEAAYRKDSFRAAKDLTRDLEQRMRDLVIHTTDEEEDILIRKIETILQTENQLSLDLAFDRTKKLIKGWRNFKKENPTAAENFAGQLEAYFDDLKNSKSGVCDKVAMQILENNFVGKWWMRTILLVVGLPIFIYGWANNFLANFIPAWTNRKLNLYIGYSSTVKSLMAIFTYPIFYGLQIWLFLKLIGGDWMVWAYIVSVVMTGLFAWWFKDFLKDTWSGWRFFDFYKKNKKQVNSIFEKRNEILKSIEKLFLRSEKNRTSREPLQGFKPCKG